MRTLLCIALCALLPVVCAQTLYVGAGDFPALVMENMVAHTDGDTIAHPGPIEVASHLGFCRDVGMGNVTYVNSSPGVPSIDNEIFEERSNFLFAGLLHMPNGACLLFVDRYKRIPETIVNVPYTVR